MMNLPDIKIDISKIKDRKSKKLKWGVAGLGRFSEQSIIPGIQLLRKSKLYSVYSRDLSRSKSIAEKFGIPYFFNSYDDFLKSDISAVYVGSANNHHYELVIKAAEAGKHILCDKPLALSSKEAEEMVNTCRKNNVFLSVNFPYRFHPLIKKAQELINDEFLGKIVTINVNFNIDYAPNDNFRFVQEYGGGALMDLGPHMLDLLRFLNGEIKLITGFVDNVVYKSPVDDFAAGIVQYERGGYGYFNVSFNNKKSFNRIDIIGYKGAISIEGLIRGKVHSAKMTILMDGEAKKAFRKGGNKLHLLLKSVQNSFIKNIEPEITGYDGLANIKLMEELVEGCKKLQG